MDNKHCEIEVRTQASWDVLSFGTLPGGPLRRWTGALFPMHAGQQGQSGQSARKARRPRNSLSRAALTSFPALAALIIILLSASTYAAEKSEPTPVPPYMRLPADVFNVEGLDKASNRIQMRALYNQAVILNYANQYGQIRPLLHRMNQLSPDAPETNYLRAMDFYHKRQVAQAIVHARKAVEESPALDPAWNFLGFLHVQAGNQEKALEAFLAAIEANPYHAVYRFNAANAYSRTGNTEEALKQIDQAIRIRPNYSDGYYLKALILREQKEYDKAFESMLLAEKTGASDVAFYMNFIDIARKADNGSKLLELMETTERMRDFGLYRVRGVVYSEYGECNRAIALLKVVPKSDMDLEAYRAYGKCLLIQNQPTDPYLQAWKLSDEEHNELAKYLDNLEISNKKWPEVKDPVVAPPR